MTITKVEAVAALRDFVQSVEALNAVHKMFGKLTRNEWKHLDTAVKIARRWVDAADGPKAQQKSEIKRETK